MWSVFSVSLHCAPCKNLSSAVQKYLCRTSVDRVQVLIILLPVFINEWCFTSEVWDKTTCIFSISHTHRDLRRDPQSLIVIGLSTNLICLNLLIVFGAERTRHKTLCTVVAIAIHYFLLTSFSWMVNESYYLYRKVVKVFDSSIKHFFAKAVTSAQGMEYLLVRACDFHFLTKLSLAKRVIFNICVRTGKLLRSLAENFEKWGRSKQETERFQNFHSVTKTGKAVIVFWAFGQRQKEVCV